MLEVIHEVLSSKNIVANIFKLSRHLARFEEHLKQPVRMHNVEKFKKASNVEEVAHDFAEGHAMTLADLIIVPSIHVFITAYNSRDLSSIVPYTLRWYRTVVTQRYVREALGFLKEIPPAIDLFTDLELPEVPNHSLYKSDPTRYKPRWKQFTRQDDVDSALE